MLRISCPWCGVRDHTEFTYGADAAVVRPPDSANAARFCEYVYQRANNRGRHEEWWHHIQGCRQWVRITRDTLTHTIEAVAPARGSAPRSNVA
jgi:heterotetrameric sarcosine oxidase delta subunit